LLNYRRRSFDGTIAAARPHWPFGPFGCDYRFARIGGKRPDKRTKAVTLQFACRRHQMNMRWIGRTHGDRKVHRRDYRDIALVAQSFEREGTNILPSAMKAIGIGEA